jgi:hypothetical protein
MRRNGRDAPIPFIREAAIEPPGPKKRRRSNRSLQNSFALRDLINRARYSSTMTASIACLRQWIKGRILWRDTPSDRGEHMIRAMKRIVTATTLALALTGILLHGSAGLTSWGRVGERTILLSESGTSRWLVRITAGP